MGIWRLKGMMGTLIKVYVLYAGRKKEGATSCNVKVQGSGGTDGWKESLLVYIQRWELKVAFNKTRDNWTKIAQKWERAVKRVTKETKRGRVTMK
jgi:hypothetical protein